MAPKKWHVANLTPILKRLKENAHQEVCLQSKANLKTLEKKHRWINAWKNVVYFGVGISPVSFKKHLVFAPVATDSKISTSTQKVVV